MHEILNDIKVSEIRSGAEGQAEGRLGRERGEIDVFRVVQGRQGIQVFRELG